MASQLVIDPLIVESARRHGINDDIILHAHAMPARPKYLR